MANLGKMKNERKLKGFVRSKVKQTKETDDPKLSMLSIRILLQLQTVSVI